MEAVSKKALSLAVGDRSDSRDEIYYINKAIEIIRGGDITISESTANERGLMQLTWFGKKDTELKTQHGIITYHDWLVLERNRIGKRPGRVAVIGTKDTERGTEYALYVNPVAVA